MTRTWPLLMVLAASLLAGCASIPSTGADAAVHAIGERMLAEGRARDAALAFENAASAERGTRRSELYLRAAEAWRQDGDLTASDRALSAVDVRRLAPASRARFDLLLADQQLRRGQPDLALDRLTGRAAALPEAQRPLWHRSRAEALAKTGQAFDAAGELSRLQPLLPRAEQAENRREIEHLLAGLDDASLIQRSADLPAGDPLYRYAGSALIKRGLELPRPFDRDAGQSGQVAAGGFRPARQLAVLLPLTGALASAAESVRDGILSAHFAQDPPRPNVRFYDTASEPARVAGRYLEAQRDGAERVIGPLGRDEVAALLAMPELPVPTLTLNRDSQALPPGHASFSLSPEEEADAIAERLIRRNLLRIVVIGDGTAVAQRSLDAFAARLTERGGAIAASAVIDPTFSNHSTALNAVFDATGGEHFDAILLAVQAREARLLAPQLAAIGLKHRPLFATSQIVLGSGDTRLDRELDGIEFPDLAWPNRHVPGTPQADGAVSRLASARGVRARLFAFGIDAYRLSGYLDQLSANPGSTLNGATGELRLDAFGNVLRQPAWSVFEGGRIRPVVDGGLTTESIRADAAH